VVYLSVNYDDDYHNALQTISRTYPYYHLILLLPASIDEILVKKPKDYEFDTLLFKAALEALKDRNYIGVIDNGLKSLLHMKQSQTSK